MLNENTNLIVTAARCLKTRNEHGSQFVRLLDERFHFLGICISAVNRQSEPEVAFVGFFKSYLKLRKKLCLRSSTTGGAVVCRNARRTPCELVGDSTSSWTHRHSIGYPKAFESEATGAREKLTHLP
jgi:hypothetical protein